MQSQVSNKKRVSVEGTLTGDHVDVCTNCGNIYVLVRLKEGGDYNDFGDRYCPFCGFMTDAFCIAVNE